MISIVSSTQGTSADPLTLPPKSRKSHPPGRSLREPCDNQVRRWGHI